MIYLDHNATTPLLPQALAAMQEFLGQAYGNPSSVHGAGRLARTAIDSARAQVAALVGAQASQVLFTSGGTEANTLAIKGLAGENFPVLVAATEHASLLDTAGQLRRQGLPVRELQVASDGMIEPAAYARALADAPRGLVSIMWANNETGVIQDIKALAAQAAAAGWLFHTDAVQAAGKRPIRFADSGAQMLSLSAHKIYGPKGVGALILDRRVALEPVQPGGGQERGLRGGTENVAGIVGFGVAAELALQRLTVRARRTEQLRELLEDSLKSLENIEIIGTSAPRVGNTSLISLRGFASETLLMALDRRGIAVSSGSACHSGNGQPSHVLTAMGVPETSARGAIRVSFGEDNSEADVGALVEALRALIAEHDAARSSSLFGEVG